MIDYKPAIDDLMRQAATITPETEAEAQETYELAQKLPPMPVGYIVKAVIRCNQMDTFRLVACDYTRTVEGRRESISTMAHKVLGAHFRVAHPYLSREQRIGLHNAVHFNFRDVGR